MSGRHLRTAMVAAVLIGHAVPALAQMKPSAVVRSKRIETLPLDGAPPMGAAQNQILIEASPYLLFGSLIGFVGGFVYARSTPGEGLYKLNDIFMGAGIGMIGGATVYVVKKVRQH